MSAMIRSLLPNWCARVIPNPLQKRVAVEIEFDTLQRLFLEQQICAKELRCLDREAKQVVHRLCIEACARTIR